MEPVTIDLNELGRRLKAAQQDVLDTHEVMVEARLRAEQAGRAYGAALEHRRQLQAAAAKAIGLSA